MKLLLLTALLAGACTLRAQDIITLKTGQSINVRVTEVGITEIKYYKSGNAQGPVYVTAKSEVSLITYSNGFKDTFSVATQPQVINNTTQQSPPTVIVTQQPYYDNGYRRNRYPVVIPHIDFGHHISIGHHGRRHH